MLAKNKFIIFSFLALAIDQLIKYFFYTHQERAGIFGYYLNINFSWSWSLSNRASAILSLLLLISLLIFYWYKRCQKISSALVLLGAGALSNLIDRFCRGGVVDYIFLPMGGVINLADIMIIAGVVWILLKTKSFRVHAG